VRQRLALDRVLVPLGNVAARHAVRERAERVVADDEVGTVLDGRVEVRGPTHAPVDVVDALDAGGLVEPGERGRRLPGLGGGKGNSRAEPMASISGFTHSTMLPSDGWRRHCSSGSFSWLTSSGVREMKP